jgi:hypothetical protein
MSTTQQPTNPAAVPTSPATPAAGVVISTRFDAELVAALDELGAAWKLDHSGTLRKLVRAAKASEKVRAAIDDADYKWSRVLPHAPKYKLMSPWAGLIGIVHHEFKKGDVLDRNLHPAELIAAIHERGARLQPLP